MRSIIGLLLLGLSCCRSTATVQPFTQLHAAAARQSVSSPQLSRAMRFGSSQGQAIMQHNPIEFYRAANVRHDMLLLSDQKRASISVNTTTLHASGEWVEICWKDVGFPAADDYVALIVPANAAMNETAPAKYQWAAVSDSHLREGHGCLKFRLINMRQSMRFLLLRNGFEYPTVAAASEEISVANPNEPTGGHLALTGKQGEMLVQWTTLDAKRPEAKWGTKSGQYQYTAAAETDTYTRMDMCGGPAAGEGWLDPGSLHRALLQGLKPDTEYFYIYGSKEHGWSEEASFVTPPPTGPQSSVSLLAIADMGQAEVDGSNENGFGEQHPSLATVRGLLDNAAGRCLVIHNGDISYARGYGSQWEVFADQIQPVARRLPWMTVGGNHERDWPESDDRYGDALDSGGECGVSHQRRFKMPAPAAEDTPWYSFSFGPIHFLQYSTEVPFNRGSPQYKFIEEDLKSVDRSKTPWLIVGGHRPIYIDSTNYTPGQGDQTVAADLREALEPLLVKYEVDMTWHGHHHSYQRTCPVQRERCQGHNSDGSAKAPVHLVIGNAGAELCWNIAPRTPDHFQVVQVMWGYMKVDANATHITCEAISDAEGAAKSRTLDKFTLTKPAGWQPTKAAVTGSGYGGTAAAAAAAGTAQAVKATRCAARNSMAWLWGRVMRFVRV